MNEYKLCSYIVIFVNTRIIIQISVFNVYILLYYYNYLKFYG